MICLYNNLGNSNINIATSNLADNKTTIQEYKQITNYENTKQVLKNIKLETPETPDIKDIKKIMLNRDEKIENEIIKPKDELIQKLHQENVSLHKELKNKYEDEYYKIDYQYQKIINKLEKENNYLKKVIDRFKITVQKFISWVCHKFSAPAEEDLIRNFERETYMDFDIEKQLNIENIEKEKQEDEL